MKYPPGPRGLEVLDFFTRRRFPHPLAFLHDAARKFGPLVYFRLLHQHTFLITGPELVKEVLVTQQHRFVRDFGASILRELVGDAVITREEPLHRERRRILQPAFHKEQIAAYVETMADEASKRADRWVRQAEAADLTEDIGAAMRATTLTVIGRLLFGDEFRSSANRISEVLAEVVIRARRLVPFVTVLKVVTRGYRRALPNGPSLFFGKQRNELDRILQPLIQQRKNSGCALKPIGDIPGCPFLSSQSSRMQECPPPQASLAQVSPKISRDVLSLLLALHDDGGGTLSSEDIRNEMVTFVLAGHETTATALTWTFYLLAQHPDIQDRAAAEVEQVCGNQLPTADDLASLPYTSAVFQETLRLYPPVALYGRRSCEAVEINGYKIPRGATVLLSPYITQRSADSYNQPEEFNPTRWLDAPPSSRFAFFPFGGGAKMCIGDVFAKTEGVVILATLLRKLRFELSSDAPVVTDPGVTLKPKQPIVLRIKKRTQHAVTPLIALQEAEA